MKGLSRRLAVGVLAAAAAVSVPSAASAATVANHSFEDPDVPSGFNTYTGPSAGITGWIVTGGSVDLISPDYWQPADGTQSVDMNGHNAGSIAQDVTTAAGQEYVLSFALSANFECGDATKQLRVLFDGVEVAAPSVNATGRSSADMGWKTLSYVVTASDSSSTIAFQSLSGNACGPVLDAVALTEQGSAGDQVFGAGLLTSAGAPPNDFALSAQSSPLGGSVVFEEQGSDREFRGTVVCLSVSGNRGYLVYEDVSPTPGAATRGGDVLVQDNGPNTGVPVDGQRNGRMRQALIDRTVARGCPIPTGTVRAIAGGEITVVDEESSGGAG